MSLSPLRLSGLPSRYPVPVAVTHDADRPMICGTYTDSVGFAGVSASPGITSYPLPHQANPSYAPLVCLPDILQPPLIQPWLRANSHLQESLSVFCDDLSQMLSKAWSPMDKFHIGENSQSAPEIVSRTENRRRTMAPTVSDYRQLVPVSRSMRSAVVRSEVASPSPYFCLVVVIPSCGRCKKTRIF